MALADVLLLVCCCCCCWDAVISAEDEAEEKVLAEVRLEPEEDPLVTPLLLLPSPSSQTFLALV